MKSFIVTLFFLFGIVSSFFSQVSSYSFSQSSGTYTAITGGTSHNTTQSDNANYSFTLPFTFTYNGTGYTVARPTTNGFLVLGANAPSTSNYTPLSSGTTNFAISAFALDLRSIVRSEVLGTAPNRIYVCQWSSVERWSGSSWQADAMNFQIRLYETTNVIDIIYGSNTGTSTSSSVQVGLRGSANTDYNNRSKTGNTAWLNNTSAGSANTSTVNYVNTSLPASGTTFTWTPPVPPTITSLGTSSGCVGSQLVINGTNLTGATAANVKIGGTAVSSIVSNTGTVLTVVVGSGTTGTVSVTTLGGSATSSSSFTINSGPTISYTGSPFQYTQNTAISNLTPTTSGTSFSSTLPAGLTINSTTGVISGTPTTPQVATNYTITATASGCSNTTTISIAVRPSNDNCSAATALSCGTSGLSGTTVGTLTETPPQGLSSNFGVWYQFVGDGQISKITIVQGIDTRLLIMSASACGGPYTTVADIDEITSTNEVFSFTTTNSTQYYVYIAHYNPGSTTTGTFTISRECVTPATNDLCANASTLTIDATAISTSFTGSSSSGGAYVDATYPDLWYKVTPTCSGSYQFALTNSSFDADIYLYSDCSSTSNLMTGGATSANNETGTATLNAGTTYYLRVVDFGQGGSTFSLQVTSVSTGPNVPSSISGSTTVCSSTTDLVYSVTNVPGTTYNWTLPSGWSQTAGGTTNSITVTAGSSSGNISVTATTTCGTSSASTLGISVSSVPSISISPSSPTICIGDIQSLTSSLGPTTTHNVGPNAPLSGATSATFGISSFYNTFNVTQAATLVSVDVFPTATIGTSASIVIANSSGTIISTTNYTTTVTGGTRQTVTINFSMSVGNGYRIGQGGSGISMRRELSLGGYPYTSSVATITGSNNGSAYYYTYNMVFSTPNTITWSPVTNLFTNTSATTSYTAGTSTQIVYARPSTTTTYTVTGTNSLGCSSTSSTSITVNSPSASSINTATGQTLTNGDFVWDGSSTTSWGTSGNWYLYNGTSFEVATTDPNTSSNVFIVPSSTTQCISSVNSPILNLPKTINNLTVVTGATLDLSSNTLNVTGNIDERGSIIGSGTINLNGTGVQTISGTGTVTLPNLTINKLSGSVSLSNPLTVGNTLTMTSGNINNGTNLLEVGTSVSSIGSIDWTSGTVTGPLKRWFTNTTNSTQSSGIFPVGNSSFNRWAQINFTSVPTSGGSITTQYVSGLASTGLNGLPLTASGQLVQNYEDEGYWDITPDSYTGSLSQATYTITLRGNNLSSPTDISVTRIIKSSGPSHTTWQACGTHGSQSGNTTDFTINSTLNTGFSFFNIASNSNSPLPVELLDFNANCSESGILLTWRTASEHNTSHFNLEKSRNGIDWQKIHTEQAAGNSTHLITYNFTDNNSLNGLNYYRLNQYDLDGVSEQFGPISINCLESNGGYFSIFPNPSSTSFTILINNELLVGDAIMLITNDLGKEVYTKNITVLPGINLFNIESLDINSGIYYLSVVNNYYTSGVIKQVIR